MPDLSTTFPPDVSASATLLAAEIDGLALRLGDIRQALSAVVFGQQEVIDQTLITLLAGGHGLLVGVPGLAKTRLVDSIGTVMGLDTKRIQCTPDLMPADILGAEILDQDETGRRHFRFVPGPVFAQLLMADEINRASPRTQSALLQAMQEHRVAVAGRSLPLPRPFHVLATQNPIEQEGTYPLPEAQLDRFLMEILVDYPDLEAERRMLLLTASPEDPEIPAILTAAELFAAQKLVRRIPVGADVVEAILEIVRAARPDTAHDAEIARAVAWGPGPRASQALLLAARARAVLTGRLAPSVDDVIALAHPVLRHRMALHYAARADGVTIPGLIDRLLETLG